MERTRAQVKRSAASTARGARVAARKTYKKQNASVLSLMRGNESATPVSASVGSLASTPLLRSVSTARSEENAEAVVLNRLCNTCADEQEKDLQAKAEPETSQSEQAEPETDEPELELQRAVAPDADLPTEEEPDPQAEPLQRQCADCAEEQETDELQRKPAVIVSMPDDPLEQEAERVADTVMQDTPQSTEPVTDTAPEEDELQRQCDDCEEEEILQRQSQGDGERVSRRPGLWQRISNVLRTGSRLPAKVARFFSARMGFDFSGVVIHTDQEASATARAINARAFTHRNHVVFAADAYQPDTRQGQHLLAHELTHVAQQSAAPVLAAPGSVATGSGISGSGASASAATSKSATSIQRDIWDDAGSVAGDVWDAGSGLVSDGVDAVGDAVEGAVALGADAIWAIVEGIAPQPLLDLFSQVRQRGFFGYIRDQVSNATDAIFGGLSDQSGVIGTVLQTFGRLAGTATTILAGLAQGDCEPLFAALRQMRDLVTELATDAWNAITDFFRPIGEFFSSLWNRFGAPVVEWLQQLAGDTWEFISGLGRQIWDWTRPVVDAIRAVVSDGWSWIKDQLGIGGGDGNSEGGLIQWIQQQAQDAWDAIKAELAPVIEPIQQVIARVQAVLPLDAIVNFRDTVNGWLQQVAETARNMDSGEGGDVAENQDSLRAILPAILESIQSFRTSLVNTGSWVADNIGAAVDTGKQFITAIATSPLVSGLRGAFTWLSTGLDNLGNWARQTVQGLFTTLGNALVWLSGFIEPVLNALRRILSVVGDLLGRLPDFLLGPLWWVLPDCIKNPIKDFFVEQILGRIPLFQQLMAAGDIWQRVQATALAILRQIFVDGDLLGAAWRFFREMLGLIGIPAQLLVQIVANAAQAFSDIMMDPVGFLGNLLRSMWQGASQFFGNIFSHLFGGITGWLFGQIEEAGLTPPDITSFRSVLGFVFDLLGLTLENIWRILADHVGQPMVDRIRGAIEFASGAWEFISVAVREGLPGLWNLIQERISDLWNIVLDSVVGWVNTAIIATGTRWLLSLLDASGITPVINSLIAIYRAIESFAQYLVQMLEIVNSVVAGIAEIAQGMIQTAADYLETTMADALPIVVGFLANQFGLGRLGERVRELVESIRERVNGALDWIIGNAVRMGRGFLDMVRSGVAAVRNWWDNRKSFRDSAGASHELYFPSERGELTVASNPTPVAAFLANLVIAETDPARVEKQNHLASARTTHGEIVRIKQDLARQPESADSSDLQSQLSQKMDELATHLSPLLGGAGDSGGRLPNPLTLATLNDAPVPTPRSAEEERIDLDGARQLVLLAAENADGSEALSRELDRIRTRLALASATFEATGDHYQIKLRATQEQIVAVNVPLRGTTPGIDLSSHISEFPHCPQYRYCSRGYRGHQYGSGPGGAGQDRCWQYAPGISAASGDESAGHQSPP